MFANFGDGRSIEDSHKILGPVLSGKVADLEKGKANGNEVIPIFATVDSAQFYAIERFTDPTTGQTQALTSGVRWIKDLNGSIKTQSGNAITADVPLRNIMDVASLPMFLSIEQQKALPALVTKAVSTKDKAIPSGSFFKTEFMGLPVWSWITIVGGIGILFIGISLKKQKIMS